MKYSDKYRRLTSCIPHLVDPVTGVVRKLYRLEKPAGAPDIYYYKAIVSNTSVFNGLDNTGITAGCSIDEEKALVRALGEAVERYCSGAYEYRNMLNASYDDLEMSAHGPSELALYHSGQYRDPLFPLEKWDRSARINWIEAVDLSDRSSVLVPASLVYCPYQAQQGNHEPRLFENISTGLAAHCSREEAAVNGLLEVIERNNFMWTWMSRSSPSPILQESLNEIHHILIRRFQNAGYAVKLFNNNGLDGIPSVIACLEGKQKGKVPLVVGSATGLDPSGAIEKCLEELALMERFAYNRMGKTFSPPNGYNQVSTLTHHVDLWLDHRFTKHAEFITASSEPAIALENIEDLSDEEDSGLDTIVRRVNAQGFKCYFADITTSDIASLGLCVGRALIPGYIPLNKAYSCRPLASRYLEERYRIQGIAHYSDHINPIPHPFA